jgi:hypothetical protein
MHDGIPNSNESALTGVAPDETLRQCRRCLQVCTDQPSRGRDDRSIWLCPPCRESLLPSSRGRSLPSQATRTEQEAYA